MLQQTSTASRLSETQPGPDDAGPIRLHTPPPRSASFVEPQPPGAGGIKPLAYLKYRWVMVLFLGGFLATVFAATAWKIIPAKFTASSMVRVLGEIPYVNGPESAQARNDFTIYFKTQAAIIKSPYVLNAALRDPAVASAAMLREQTDPIRFLEEELKIESPESSEVIKISLSGENPRETAMIVNAIQGAYFTEVVDDEVTRKKARLTQLEDSIAKMQEEVRLKFGQLKNAGADSVESDTLYYMSVQRAMDQQIKLEETRGKMETDLQSWKNELEKLEFQLKHIGDEEPALPQGFMQSITSDPKMQVLAKKIETESSRIDYFTKLAGDPENPSVVQLRKKVEELKEERERFRRERVEEHRKSELPHLERSLKDKIEQTKATITHLVASLKTQNDAIDKYTKTLQANGLTGMKAPNFPAVDFRERSQMIVQMINKANMLRTEVNAPPRVQDFQRASVPMKKEMKKQLLGTIFAGLIGFGLVGFGVVVHESRIRRAMSLADVQQSVLGPLVGVLPLREEGANALASAQATGEAIEKTRTHLLQQFSQAGGKVIAITSALTEEGKGFLASRLAESFTRMGSKTLLLDFDLRQPTLHQLVHASPERGLCEVMLGQVEFNDAIQVLPNGMMFLPAGKWRDEMRLALTSERIEAFLNWLRPQFDCVVMNTHPLLTVAETFLVCRHADGVLLSVERLESRLPLTARAHEKLAVVAPEAFGVVFQGANTEECCQ